MNRYGTAALATVAVGGALVVGRTAAGITLPCPLLALTGIPCPLCGTTTLATMVLRGELTDALTVDPAGVVVLATLALLAGIHATGGRSATLGRLRAVVPTIAMLGIAGLAIHWLTTVVTGGALSS